MKKESEHICENCRNWLKNPYNCNKGQCRIGVPKLYDNGVIVNTIYVYPTTWHNSTCRYWEKDNE